MKLIIDIDKDYYELIKADVKSGNDYKPCVLIANGKPCDEALTRQSVKDECNEWTSVCTGTCYGRDTFSAEDVRGDNK